MNCTTRQQLLKDYLDEANNDDNIDLVLLSVAHTKSEHVAIAYWSYSFLNYAAYHILGVDGEWMIW